MKLIKIILVSLCLLSLFSPVSAASYKNHSTKKLQRHVANVVKPKRIQKVDLNKADAKTLAKVLKRVGRKRAAKIIAYRKKHGPFTSVDGLTHVPGIGANYVKKYSKDLHKVLFVARRASHA